MEGLEIVVRCIPVIGITGSMMTPFQPVLSNLPNRVLLVI